MSLVNLAHVCSHLQNASLARLGLTSIPYSKLHLSLSLLLQKQGFLSDVKLAGLNPPASCFPPGLRDNHRISGQPHTDRSPLSREAALTAMVMGRMRRRTLDQTREAMREKGFSEETIAWAEEYRDWTPQRLQTEGISVETPMGVAVHNQPISLINEEFQDPYDIETEGVVTQANRASRRLWLGMKYWDGMPVLKKARMVSKPTKRLWLNTTELGRVIRGNSAGEVHGMTRVGEIMAVSTDAGLFEARECVERRIGGQVLCRIW